MVKLLFFQFRFTNSNLKNIKLHFELLAQSRLILGIQFFLCPVPLEHYQEKTSLLENLGLKTKFSIKPVDG